MPGAEDLQDVGARRGRAGGIGHAVVVAEDGAPWPVTSPLIMKMPGAYSARLMVLARWFVRPMWRSFRRAFAPEFPGNLTLNLAGTERGSVYH